MSKATQLQEHPQEQLPELTSRMLIDLWKTSWIGYYEEPNDDSKSIIQLSDKVCKELKIDTTTEYGRQRLYSAIVNIAEFCSNNIPWCFKNIYYANMAFQTLYNHMMSVKKMQKIKSQDYNYTK